ncbi:MAG: hypothetical protein NBV68_05945 [Erythrobacter sp.]|uniref:hypothetical protein n=1 Tax=Erythrobacter sp. TaxID=1042 RepID=UPI0025F8706F|nr:hypothetical protein [Erythrobacter sp.]MCL9998903.1 hypothetical protein [Erythrobacter sp.]
MLSSSAAGSTALASLSPSGQWDGTPGTGFAVTPTDPPRTTAKPACRLVTVPGQRFTATHVVGVVAFANDGGTLIGGIDRVRFHFEGETRDVLEMTPRTFMRRDGTSYRCWAYWVALRKPAGKAGSAQLFVEAIPADATMQRRVIGPFLYSVEDALHDLAIEVAATPAEMPGERYKTLEAAIDYAKAQSARNPLITVTETGTYLPTETGPAHTFTNWCTIEAASGVTCTIARDTQLSDSQSRIVYVSDHICFRNVTFDMRRIASIQSANNTPFWADRCTITNSDPDRGFARWRGNLRPHGIVFEGNSYVTDCRFEYLPNPLGADAALLRGNFVTDGTQDVMGDAQCVVANTVRNWDSSEWINGRPILSVTYTGSEATARLSAPIVGGDTRILTATWGANSATLTLGKSEADFLGTTGNAYWPSHVVDWLNTLPDWTATLLDDTLVAFNIDVAEGDPDEDASGRGGNKSVLDINVKDTVKTCFARWDVHADGYQQRWGGTDENVIIAANDWQVAGQILFISSTDPYEKDYFIINNIFRFLKTAADVQGLSALAQQAVGVEPPSALHMIVAHNSWVNQLLRMRWDAGFAPDGYSLIANNVVQGLRDQGVASAPAGVIVNNHIYATAENSTAATFTSVGGDATTLFADAANADFTPSGDLLTNARVPVLNWDAHGRERKALDAVGAVASGFLTVTDYTLPSPPPSPPPPPPPLTEWSFEDFSTETTGIGGQAEIVSATIGRTARVEGGNSGLVLALPPGTYRLRGTLTEWAGKGATHLRMSSGSLVTPVNFTPDAGIGLYTANGVVDCTFTFAAAGNLVLRCGVNARSFTLTRGGNPLVQKVG